MSHVHGPHDHEHVTPVTPVPPTTERQVIVTGGDGGGAGWIIALIVLLALIIGGIFLYRAVVETGEEGVNVDVNTDEDGEVVPEDDDDVVVPEDEGS